MFPDDPGASLALVERIGAVALLVSSLEQLARPRSLGATGLLSWEVAQLRSADLTDGLLNRVLDPLCRTPGVLVILALRALAATAVVVASTPSAIAVTLCAASTALLMLRSSYGNDGADQMGLIVFIAAVVAHAVGGAAVGAVLWFITAQACLSYLTSGIAKARGQRWRDGSGLVGVVGTRTYGARVLWRVLHRHRWLAVALSWSVILTESLFPLVLVAPDATIPFILLAGLAFHLSTAVVMGLNTFVWAFGAAYPAIAWCALHGGRMW